MKCFGLLGLSVIRVSGFGLVRPCLILWVISVILLGAKVFCMIMVLLCVQVLTAVLLITWCRSFSVGRRLRFGLSDVSATLYGIVV